MALPAPQRRQSLLLYVCPRPSSPLHLPSLSSPSPSYAQGMGFPLEASRRALAEYHTVPAAIEAMVRNTGLPYPQNSTQSITECLIFGVSPLNTFHSSAICL